MIFFIDLRIIFTDFIFWALSFVHNIPNVDWCNLEGREEPTCVKSLMSKHRNSAYVWATLHFIARRSRSDDVPTGPDADDVSCISWRMQTLDMQICIPEREHGHQNSSYAV